MTPRFTLCRHDVLWNDCAQCSGVHERHDCAQCSGVHERLGGMLEASELTADGCIRTCFLHAEARECARTILGRDPNTPREVFAASEAHETVASTVLLRQRRRWIAWLEMHGDEPGAALAARVKEKEVL